MEKYKPPWEFNKNYVTNIKKTMLYDGASSILKFQTFSKHGVGSSPPPPHLKFRKMGGEEPPAKSKCRLLDIKIF